jgi:branched-chain amino acid aminotransferase
VFVSVEPFLPVPEHLRVGVVCVTLRIRRKNPGAKDTHFIATAAMAYGTLPPGAHEGLLVGEDGAILEGLSSNFFGIKDGVLLTEEGRVLPGITRNLVLEVAAGVVPVSLVAVRSQDLPTLAEAFITSASRGILPVVRVDGVVIGEGHPGPTTRELARRFEDLIEREAEPL